MENILFIDVSDSDFRRVEEELGKYGFSNYTKIFADGKSHSQSFVENVISTYPTGVGCFCILTGDRRRFSENFPNNTVEMAVDSIPHRTAKEIVHIMTNFGREDMSLSGVYVTSDTHFNHSNIIRYCNRPFKDVDEMNEALIDNWNSVVGKNDKVIHLGDFAFGNRAKVENVFKRLNGKIDIVLGNHDRLKIKDYYDIGFHRVYDKPIVFANFFILSHAPLQWLKEGDVYANLFGHVHDNELYRTYTRNTCCACVERHGYRPIGFNDLKARFAELGG